MCCMVAEIAFTFVYRDVLKSSPLNVAVPKRKAGIFIGKKIIFLLFNGLDCILCHFKVPLVVH